VGGFSVDGSCYANCKGRALSDDDQDKDRDEDKTDKDRDEERDEDNRTATSPSPIIFVPIFVVRGPSFVPLEIGRV